MEKVESGGESIRDLKRRGEWAEIRFIAKAMEHGYRVTTPLNGSPPYDVVVDLGGLFISVQVKSTTSLRQGRRKNRPTYCYSVNMVRSGHNNRYGLVDFHYLAAFIIPRELWYIIPFRLVVGRSTVLLRPDDPPDNGYEKYREAWHLLREVPDPVGPGVTVKHERYWVDRGRETATRRKKHSSEEELPEALEAESRPSEDYCPPDK